MKSKFVKRCKNPKCNKMMYGYNAPSFCSSGCEYRYNLKEGI